MHRFCARLARVAAAIALLVLVGALLSPALAGANKHKEDDDVFVSAQQVASDNGFFNIDAICPQGYEVITGGYEVLSPDISTNFVLLDVLSNTFHFHFNNEGEAEADGWQTIGLNLSSLGGNHGPVTVRVTASCKKEGKKE